MPQSKLTAETGRARRISGRGLLATVGFLGLAMGGFGAPAALARPAGPAALPPDKVPWFNTLLPGGPMFDVAAGPVAKGRQKVFAAGNVVFTSDQGSAWSRARSDTGRLVHLLAGPSGTTFGSSVTGVGWRTTNYGRNWERMAVRSTDPVKFAAVSPNFAVDHQVYAITQNDFRLYRSGNSGANWAAVEIKPNATKRLEVGAITYSPLHAFDEIQFAGTDEGIFKSSNAGQSWELVSGPENGAPAFGGAAGPLIYQGLIISPEYGDDRKRAADPLDTTLFAYNVRGVYRSDDDAKTWRRLPLQMEELRDLALSNGWPRDPVLMAAVKAPGIVGARSTDGGASWTPIAGRDGVAGTGVAMAVDFAPTPGPDPVFLARIYLPLALKRVPIGLVSPPVAEYIGSREAYLSTDGDGMLRSTDAGVTWWNESLTLSSAQPGPLAFLPGGPDAPVLAGTESSGLYRSPDGGRTWRWVDSGLPRGAGQDVTSIGVSPAFATDHTVFLGATSGVWVSHDAGAHWSKTPAPAGARQLLVSPSFADDHTLLMTGYLSTDGGGSWTPVTDPGGTWAGAAFSPNFATDRTLWVTLEGKPKIYSDSMLRRSTDGGRTWSVVGHNVVNGHELGPVSAFQMEADPVKVYVGADTGLLTTSDDGKTWTRITGNSLTQPVNDIVVRQLREPITAIILAVGAEGVMWSNNRGISWSRESLQLRQATGAAISHDGSVLLASVPVAVSRYGLGSARTSLPAGSK